MKQETTEPTTESRSDILEDALCELRDACMNIEYSFYEDRNVTLMDVQAVQEALEYVKESM